MTTLAPSMTNMSCNIARADHGKYLAHAGPLNFSAAAIVARLLVLSGVFQ